MSKDPHSCMQNKVIDKLVQHDEDRGISMATLTLKMDNLEKGQERIEKKLDTFIETAGNTYATKKELLATETRLKEANARQDENFKSLSEKVWDIAKKLGLVIGTLLIIANLMGLDISVIG